MQTAAHASVALVALIHVYFLVLEMFLWDTPRGRAAFGTTEEFAARSATLAANQGLYNGFMAAGLIWGLIMRRPRRSPGPDLLPELSGGRGCVRGGHRQPQDPVRPGGARRARPGPRARGGLSP